MVSFNTQLSPTRRKIMREQENSSEKRKRDDDDDDQEIFYKAKTRKFAFDHSELHLQTPLPLEWQRCLDIKSGQIYYYNTKTKKRTSSDPRLSREPRGPSHMSLDLELNLNTNNDYSCKKTLGFYSDKLMNSSTKNNNNGGLGFITRSPSWLNFEDEQQEMVTAVCKNCHMLVIMCKSSPACPNCKFMHSHNQTAPTLSKFSLLCKE